MKKTLLATAIAGALGVSAAAQAATVYDQDGTKLDLYGRIAVAVTGGGPENKEVKDSDGVVEAIEKANGSEFVDMGTRLGVRGSQQITSDLSAYGRVEFRFDGDEDTGGLDGIKHTYLGLKSNTYGSIQAGQFDSVYLNSVSAPFDVWVNKGLEFDTGGESSVGDSVAYISPNLEGFQVYLQGKHHSGNGQDAGSAGSNSSTIETAGGAVYEVDALRLALGYAENSDDEVVGNSGEVLYGATAAYAFTPEFSARVGYETKDNDEDKIGVGATYSVGSWAVYGNYYHITAEGTNKQDRQADGLSTDRDSWALGTTYNVSSNFQVFAEVYESDQDNLLDEDDTLGDVGDNLRDARDSVLWTAGARYFF